MIPAQSATFPNDATLVGNDAGDNALSAAGASGSTLVEAFDITLGKSVDKTFIGSLPSTVTYTLSPRSDNAEPLENVRVIDPYPVGLTAPPIAVGQGGTYGPYAPIAALPGSDPGPPALNTAMSVSTNFVIQGGTVTVTLNVKSSVAVSNVSPSDLDLNGGIAVCPGPSPLVANVPAGGAGVNFTWTCTLAQLGEYVFTADAADLTDTTSWPAASSASVLSAAGGGPNVVTWNLGSNTAAVPGQTITSGFTAGVFAFRGAGTTTFRKYGIDSAAWTPRTDAPGTVNQGGALTTDGAGTIYALRGNDSQAFWADDVATGTWTAKADTGQNVTTGGALVYLNSGGTERVYATMGGQRVFKRYNVAANTWNSLTSPPFNVNKGGALTTDGTFIYLLRGGSHRDFARYSVGGNTWVPLAPLPAKVGWGGSLTRVGGFIYAMSGDAKRTFFRYSIAADSWTPVLRADGALAITPGNVADGGALTTDGTFIYAFQGLTTAFWRYDIAADAWTVLAPFSAATGQGGALAFVPGLDPQGQLTTLSASRSLVVTGDQVTVTLRLDSNTPVNNVVASPLTVTPAGGASCSALTGPILTSPDDDDLTAEDAVVYEWTCTVAAGATPGSLTFSASGTGDGPLAFPAATSNSVLVSPPLTFTAAVPVGAPSPIVDQALLTASGQTTSSPPVQTFIGAPVLTTVKSNAPTASVTLVPGDPITYTMVVQNTGVGDATNVVVRDVVPADTGYVSCTGGTSCAQAAGVISWTLGTLASGATATVSFTVTTSTTLPVSQTPYTISNTATATSTETPIPANSNTVTNQLEVTPTIIKSASASEAGPGEPLTYSLAVSNPGATFTADVSDVVPVGTAFAGIASCTPACTFDGTKVIWPGADHQPGKHDLLVRGDDHRDRWLDGDQRRHSRRHDPRSRPDRQQPDRDSHRTRARHRKAQLADGRRRGRRHDHLHAGRQQRRRT